MHSTFDLMPEISKFSAQLLQGTLYMYEHTCIKLFSFRKIRQPLVSHPHWGLARG